MANAVFPEYKEFLLGAAADVSLTVDDATNGPFCRLVDTGTYTFSALHDFADDIVGGVGTDQRITAPTVANGTFDGGDLTYTAVSGASIEALVLYRHNAGANTTWKVVLYLDTGVTGLPVTPNGGNITVTWNVSGIFTISDRRLKRDVQEIGDLFGVLPLYEFAYHDSERRRVGLMAQDVERLVPEAVIDLGPCKAVCYQRAIAGAQGLAA
jgi:hypothetical protein